MPAQALSSRLVYDPTTGPVKAPAAVAAATLPFSPQSIEVRRKRARSQALSSFVFAIPDDALAIEGNDQPRRGKRKRRIDEVVIPFRPPAAPTITGAIASSSSPITVIKSRLVYDMTAGPVRLPGLNVSYTPLGVSVTFTVGVVGPKLSAGMTGVAAGLAAGYLAAALAQQPVGNGLIASPGTLAAASQKALSGAGMALSAGIVGELVGQFAPVVGVSLALSPGALSGSLFHSVTGNGLTVAPGAAPGAAGYTVGGVALQANVGSATENVQPVAPGAPVTVSAGVLGGSAATGGLVGVASALAVGSLRITISATFQGAGVIVSAGNIGSQGTAPIAGTAVTVAVGSTQPTAGAIVQGAQAAAEAGSIGGRSDALPPGVALQCSVGLSSGGITLPSVQMTAWAAAFAPYIVEIRFARVIIGRAAPPSLMLGNHSL